MFRDSSLPILNRVSAVIVLVLLMASSAWSVSYQALYSYPYNSPPGSGLITDANGNAYGTTLANGNNGGTVFQLSPTTGFHVIYVFNRISEGWRPQGNLVLDSAGDLYGTTEYGGDMHFCAGAGCGLVFKLSPPSNGGLWTETVLYTFCLEQYCPDGNHPMAGVVFDSAGNLYGTTVAGGNIYCQCGVVFELSPTDSGWSETVVHTFTFDEGDGFEPAFGLTIDQAGNLFGTTERGGSINDGTVYELSPASGGWTETIIDNFDGVDGFLPVGMLALDSAGNLYGATNGGGPNSSGMVFELSPDLGGAWTETILHSFEGGNHDGYSPNAGPTLDSAGNLYGTTELGGPVACGNYSCGTVYRLSPGEGGVWNESLFIFPKGGARGWMPTMPVLIHGNNVYGNTVEGGKNDYGVVFKITP